VNVDDQLPQPPLYALALQAEPVAVTAARELAKAALGAWRMPDLVDDVILVTSELVTNGIRAGHMLAFLIVAERPGEVVLYVWDDGPGTPLRQESDVDALNGRGLTIIQALSSEWGWFPVPGGGKIVYASLGSKPIKVPDAA
jgi:anti-sigma regulatory factor (Ser/Thr protein kinase)